MMKLKLLVSVITLLFLVNAFNACNTCNAQPVISINGAGNEDEASFGADTSKHFFRNGTWQNEDWIHINATIKGATNAWVEFKNQSGWYNHSMTNSWGDIWTVTIEDNPEWRGYTFNIHAEDSDGGTARKKWLYYDYEDSWGVEEDYRKYVGLGANQQNFSYEQFYHHDVFYRSEQINSRVLKQEQPTDGTVHDTDLMFYRQSSGPQETWCDLFVAMFLGESMKVDNVVIDNIYVHTWWNTTDGELEVNWYKEKEPQISRYAYDSYTTDTNSSKHTANLSSDGFTHEHYNLEAKKWDVSSHAFEDNEINLLRLKFSGARPSIISTDSYRSFVIFNLPDNSTLQDQDSDGDGLNDFEELYVYHTDPFDSDTDNDGESDGDDDQPLDPSSSNTAPDSPSSPSPSNGVKIPSTTSPNLSVDVNDPSKDSMEVCFYDHLNDSPIDCVNGVTSGGTVSVTWTDLSAGDCYSWYAIADDGSETKQSPTWTFTINEPPNADFDHSPEEPLTGETIDFDGTLSSDSDGSVACYEWDLTCDGNYDATGSNPSHSYSEDGEYKVRLKVTDSIGNTDTATQTINITSQTPTQTPDTSPAHLTKQTPLRSLPFAGVLVTIMVIPVVGWWRSRNR